jgi:hypothetical protein
MCEVCVVAEVICVRKKRRTETNEALVEFKTQFKRLRQKQTHDKKRGKQNE